MDKKLKGRFCSHRGDRSAGRENSYDAIKAAVEQGVFYVEFDVIFKDDSWWTGHPPDEPIDKLEHVLFLFKDNETFPKIDLKMSSAEDYYQAIDAILAAVKHAGLKFTLINIGKTDRDRKSSIETLNYLAEQVRGFEYIKLNIDLQYYRPHGEPIDEGIHQHVSSLGDFVFAMSPEIHKEDPDAMGRFAQQHNIPYVCFWLLGYHVKEETLLEALKVEEKYGVKVLFDMNKGYVTESDNP